MFSWGLQKAEQGCSPWAPACPEQRSGAPQAQEAGTGQSCLCCRASLQALALLQEHTGALCWPLHNYILICIYMHNLLSKLYAKLKETPFCQHSCISISGFYQGKCWCYGIKFPILLPHINITFAITKLCCTEKPKLPPVRGCYGGRVSTQRFHREISS